jgi:hypothetical protein
MAKKGEVSGEEVDRERRASEKLEIGWSQPIELTDLTLRQLQALGRRGYTEEQAACFFGVTERTLEDFFVQKPQAQISFMRGRAQWDVGIRRVQFRLAKTDPRMAIHLGKIYLGQSDTGEKPKKTAKGDINIVVADDK